jgi:predicted ribosome quality control (RQC) complex YloA/Tae2 family protein
MFSNLLQIVELYDKGNLILTDKDLVILNVLRPRVQGEEKFLVRETYSFDQVRFTY